MNKHECDTESYNLISLIENDDEFVDGHYLCVGHPEWPKELEKIYYCPWCGEKLDETKENGCE